MRSTSTEQSDVFELASHYLERELSAGLKLCSQSEATQESASAKRLNVPLAFDMLLCIVTSTSANHSDASRKGSVSRVLSALIEDRLLDLWHAPPSSPSLPLIEQRLCLEYMSAFCSRAQLALEQAGPVRAEGEDASESAQSAPSPGQSGPPEPEDALYSLSMHLVRQVAPAVLAMLVQHLERHQRLMPQNGAQMALFDASIYLIEQLILLTPSDRRMLLNYTCTCTLTL